LKYNYQLLPFFWGGGVHKKAELSKSKQAALCPSDNHFQSFSKNGTIDEVERGKRNAIAPMNFR